MEKVKILIVDDFSMIRTAWAEILKGSNNYEVVGEASNGEDAIMLLSKLKVDIVLMDISMPIMSGIEATKIISNSMPWVKIIALTMYVEYPYAKAMLNAGAKGFVTKASTKEALFNAIETVYGGGTFICSQLSSIMYKKLKDKESNKPESAINKTLTVRELEIIKLIVEGNTTREISFKLSISPKTIENHKARIFQKLEIKNIVALTKYAIEEGIFNAYINKKQGETTQSNWA